MDTNKICRICGGPSKYSKCKMCRIEEIKRKSELDDEDVWLEAAERFCG